jgi:hypothetical protein
VVEMPATAVEKLIKEYKAEFFSEDDGDDDSPKIKTLITENTYAEVSGKTGTCVREGEIYYLKPSVAAILIGMGKARFPDTAVMVEVRFNSIIIFKGCYFKANDTAKLPVNDTEELIRRSVVEPISLIEESQGILETEEKKKSFFEKVLGK